MRFVLLAGLMPEYRFFGRELEYFADFDVGLVPLEYENAVGLEHAETLRKAFRDHFPPIVIQRAVLDLLPARGRMYLAQAPVHLFVLALAAVVKQMRGIEHDEPETPVGERQTGKVGVNIGFDLERASVAKRGRYIAVIAKEHARIGFVEVKHLAAAAHV